MLTQPPVAVAERDENARHVRDLRMNGRELASHLEIGHGLVGGRDDVVLVCLGVPSALEVYPDAAMRICTYSDVPVSQQALAEFLVAGK